MNKYSEEYLNQICATKGIFIIETIFNEVLLGYLVKNAKNNYMVLPLAPHLCIECLSRGQIKRIINLNGYVHSKNENSKRYTMLNLFQLNELVNKAGYEFI